MNIALLIPVLVLAIASSVQGWWDMGHSLVGDVARQLMDPADVVIIHRLLRKWNKDFPNTNEISTAAIWPDLLKCDTQSPYCPSPLTPSVKTMDDWHYLNLPLNVNGSDWNGKEADPELFKASFDGEASDTLEQAVNTFATTKSAWAANFMIRYFIHIFGDIHQPLHTSGGVSEGLPKGDMGGNAYKFNSPCVSTNLHALWDSAGGHYTINWSLNTTDTKPYIEGNATALIKNLLPTLTDTLNYEKLRNVEYKDFRTELVKNNLLKKTMLISYDLARKFVYTDLDLKIVSGKVPCPNQAYLDRAFEVSNKQIVLGGYRLSIILTQFAKQIKASGIAPPAC